MITLTPDENIIRVIRRHWFILLVRTFGLLVILVTPFIFFSLGIGNGIFQETGTAIVSISPSVWTFLGATWILVVWLRFFHDWTDHYLDGWVITDKRIIDIEQRGFFSREVSSFRMERLQDVTTDVHGIIATLLNFGNVHVQTAGEDQDFIIKGAPDPKKLKELILSESDKYLEEIRASGSNT
jgi:uncharacterized membrane protein YdbT with pleckstrin-like domain